MTGDLLGPPLCRDVLGAGERSSSLFTRKAQEVFGDQRDSSARAFLPWCVGRRIDHDLPHDPPSGVVGVAPRDKKPRKRLSHIGRPRFGAVTVEMAQGRADTAAVLDSARKLQRTTARFA